MSEQSPAILFAELPQIPKYFDKQTHQSFMEIVGEFEAAPDIVDKGGFKVGEDLIEHSERVAALVYDSSWQVFDNQDFNEAMFLAALMHDYGKLRIGQEDPNLLNTTKAFGEEQKLAMTNHTRYGFEAFGATNDKYSRLAKIVAGLHHNFNIDNAQAYEIPDSMRSEVTTSASEYNVSEKEIMMAVLFISIADVYDAIHNRDYVDPKLKYEPGTNFYQWCRQFLSVEHARVLDTADFELCANSFYPAFHYPKQINLAVNQ